MVHIDFNIHVYMYVRDYKCTVCMYCQTHRIAEATVTL